LISKAREGTALSELITGILTPRGCITISFWCGDIWAKTVEVMSEDIVKATGRPIDRIAAAIEGAMVLGENE
jgi:hypothetical protein